MKQPKAVTVILHYEDGNIEKTITVPRDDHRIFPEGKLIENSTNIALDLLLGRDPLEAK